jgi:hypothetical protein
MLDRALDAAESKLDNEAETVEKPVKQVEITESEAIEEAPEQEQNSDQEANVEAADPAQAQEQTPEADMQVNAPAFWSTEQKALFAGASKPLQKVIADSFLAVQQHTSRLANEAQRAKAFERDMYSDMENDPQKVADHKAQLRLNNIKNEVEELHRYRDWDRVFKSNVSAGLIDLGRKNNITPETYAALYYGENVEHDEQLQEDPRIEELQNELKSWKEQQEVERLTSTVNTFKQGVDARGQVRERFSVAYAPQIDAAVKEIEQEYPEMQLSEKLHHAYEYVYGQVAELHNLSTSQPQAKAPVKPEAIAAAKKAQVAAASSTTGAPTTGIPSQRSRLKGKNFSEKLDNLLDETLSDAGL